MAEAAQAIEQLIVIGASAGGSEALSRLVAGLPTPFPAPIVIAQHIERHRTSQLAAILGRQSTLPVRSIENRARLENGVIFVVPADRHVEIDDGEAHLTADDGDGPMPSVNRLFRGAARAYGERLIAVVLTGTDADGAIGAEDVKAAGGMVIIQNPATARFPSMPASLSPALIDVEIDVEQLGPLLHELVSGVYLPPPVDQDLMLQQFLAQVREQSGVDFTSYKMATIRRRLQRRMAAVKTRHLAEYARYVQAHPEEYEQLVNSFLIKVTEFFRDPDLYGYVREQVVPRLIDEARRDGHELRIWSAGCATGQETYSLAILIAEALGPELARFTVRIFGTDLDAGAIEVARHGIYPASALDNVPRELREHYFTRQDGFYQVNRQIRGLTIFGQHDLGQRAPFPRIDLCICRNVLIYFTPDLQARALQLFAFALRDGGVLVLGKSETIGPVADYFCPLQQQLKVFRRQGERLMIPAARVGQLPRAPRPATSAGGARGGAWTAVAAPREQTTRMNLVRYLLALPIGMVVVNRRYDIQMLNGAAAALLDLHDAAIGEDLIHLANGVPEGQLRAIIDAALQAGTTRAGASPAPAPTVERVIPVDTLSGERRYLRVVCRIAASASDMADEGQHDDQEALLVLSDVTGAETERRAVAETDARAQREQTETLARVEEALVEARERARRLTEDNRALRAANQRLITANIELRNANEGAIVSTEEAQAAMEEIETLNEELQAGNEELETLNEELQASNKELELQAQRLDQQRRFSEAERAQLQAILNSLGDAVLVVHADGTSALINPAYDALFSPATEARLDDAAGELLPAEETPRARAARGQSFSMQFTLRDATGDRHWFEAQGEPVRIGGEVRWGVVVIRDITERSLRQLQDDFVANVSHGLQTPITVIRASLGLLSTGAAARLTEEERDLLASARQHGEQLRTQIEDLLTANQVRTGAVQLERTSLDLRELVTTTLESLRVLFEEQQQQVSVELPEPLLAQVDARRVEQVLLNLLTNAQRHTPAGTHVTIAGGRDRDAVWLVVRDDGPGIPEESLEAIFQPFRRLGGRVRGSGLGLSIARSLVTLHGGTLWAERPAAGGIAFHITLPVTARDGEG